MIRVWAFKDVSISIIQESLDVANFVFNFWQCFIQLGDHE